MSYKATLHASAGRVYRNKDDARIPTTRTPEIQEFNFNIGEFEKIINLEDFTPKYFKNDVNQEHPVYILHNLPYPTINIADEETPEKDMFDLKGEKVSTFFTNDTFEGGVIGMGFTNNYNHTAATTPKGDEEDVEPGERFNRFRVKTNQLMYYYADTYGDSIMRPKWLYKRIFRNGEIDGIQGIYNANDDTVTVPMFNNETNYFEYYNKDNTKVILRTVDSSGIRNSIADAGGYVYLRVGGAMRLVREGALDKIFYLPISTAISNIDGTYFVIGTTTTHQNQTKTIPIFLRDNNGEYWVLTFTNINVYDGNQYPRTLQNVQYNVMLMKFKDIPLSGGRGTFNTLSPTWVTTQDFPDLHDIDLLLDEMFNPEKEPEEDYNDGGPDAIGPGDSFEDVDNIEDIVGGDIDLEDELDEDDPAPNNSTDSFRQSYGFFGSYKLTPENLIQYTNTLSLYYKHSSDLLLGTIYNHFGDRISKNTTGVIILPYDVPEGAGKTITTNFAMGNTGIINDPNDWITFINGGNLAQAKLITKEIYEYPVNLGTISHYYDSFLDFAPYSSATLYMPYIGEVSLPMNLVQSTSKEQKQLTLLYRINNTTGEMVVLLQVNGMTIGHWNGNCARSFQLSVDDNSGVIKDGFKQLMGIVGAGASIAANGANPVDIIKKGADNLTPSSSPVNQHAIGNMANTGALGFMDTQQIILTVERPIMWRPTGYGDLVGYPTQKVAKLGSVKGFARVTNLHLRCAATKEEKALIEEALKQGVIF